MERLVFRVFEHARVSIVVPAYNEWRHTHLCLRAVLEHTAAPAFEVLLADDASTDRTMDAPLLLDNVVVVRDGRRRGFLGNCNQAARFARGEYLVLLNNDTVVQPGWLEALVATADRDPRIGIVGAKILYEDGRLQDAGGVVYRDGSAARYGKDGDPAAPAYNQLRDVDYVSGCCLLVRRDLWRRLGGFDGRYSPGYYEDVDLAFRVRANGFRVVYEPGAVVAHSEGASHGHDPSSGAKRFLPRNAEIFRSTWAEELVRDRSDRPPEPAAWDPGDEL